MPYFPWMTPEAKKLEEDINPYLVAIPLTAWELARETTPGLKYVEKGERERLSSLPFLPSDWGKPRTTSEWLKGPKPSIATEIGKEVQAAEEFALFPGAMKGAMEMLPKAVRSMLTKPILGKVARPAIPPKPPEVQPIPTTPVKTVQELPQIEPNPYMAMYEIPEMAPKPEIPISPEIKVKRAELFDIKGGTPETEAISRRLEPLRQKNALTDPQRKVIIPAKNIMEATEFSQEVHYMPPSEWMKVPELNLDALSVSRRVGIAPENLEYVGLQKFTPLSQDAMHLWNVVDKGSELFGSTVAGPKFQLSKGKSKSLLKSEA